MKVKLLPLCYLLFFSLLTSLTTRSQKIDQRFYEQVVAPFKGSTDVLPVDCFATLPTVSCNYLRNIDFDHTIDYNPFGNPSHIKNPFGLNLVPQWDVSHGTPQITDGVWDFDNSVWLQFPSSPPPPATGFANFFSLRQNTSVPVESEGIAQRIQNLVPGNKYLFSFFDKFRNYHPMGDQKMDAFYVILMHCDPDAGVFTNLNNFPPILTPGAFQTIVCQEDIIHTNWQRYTTTFTATQDFDMILIYPAHPTIQSFVAIPTMQFAYPELIDVSPNKFTAGPDPVVHYPNCNVTIGPPTPNCGVANAVFTWTSPTGTPYAALPSQQRTVDASVQANVGTWKLSMTVPGALTPNGVCSEVAVVFDEVYVAYCCPHPTVSPAGPIDYYLPIDAAPNGRVLTSNTSTGNQWYYNNVAIPGATSQTYTVGSGWSSIATGNYSVLNNGCMSNVVHVEFKRYGYGNYGEDYFDRLGAKIHPVQTSNYYCYNTNNNFIQQFDLGPTALYTWNFRVWPTGGTQNVSITPGSYNPNSNQAQVNVGGPTGAYTYVQGVADLNGSEIILDYYLTLSHPDFIPTNQEVCANAGQYIENFSGSSYSTLPGGSGFDWEFYDFGPAATILSGPGIGQSWALTPGRSTPQQMVVRYTGPSFVQKHFYYNWGGCYKEEYNVTLYNGCLLGKEAGTQNKIYIYPNPASNQISITSTEAMNYIEISDFMNPILKRIKTNGSKSIQINVSDLKPGVYTCRIITDKGIENQKLIIKR